MSYVKNYNPGQIRMDLPTANYIHELPLLSFSDIHGGVNLSLVFNYAMKATEDDPNPNPNPFNIAPGYKLNLQKRLIMENNVPVQFQDESGKCVYLIGDSFPYTFGDDSQRILRASGNSLAPYAIENPDFSVEKYNSSGMIVSAVDKYGVTVLTYTYTGNNKLTSILYRGKQIIQFSYYDSNNQLENITFNGKSSRLAYLASGISVSHYSGVNYSMASSSDMNFTATASAFEGGTAAFYKTQLVKDSLNNTVTVSNLIDTDVVSTTSYKYPDEPECYFHYSQVDITDNRGAQTRIQYQDGKPLYSYEVFGADEAFLNGRFKGNVTLYGPQGNPGAYKATGVQTREGGLPLTTPDANGYWCIDISGNANANGYYTVSGWIKSKDNNTTSSTISVGGSPTTMFDQWEIDLSPIGQWKYFSCMFNSISNYIYVHAGDSLVNKDNGRIDVADLRLTFQKTGIIKGGESSHTNMTEYILTNGTKEIPFKDASFYRLVNGAPQYYSGVTAPDILRRKLKHKTGGSCTEVYYENCTGIDTGVSDLYVSFESESYRISDLDVATKTYSQNNVYLTRMSIAETNARADILVQTYTNGVLTGVQKLNNKLDTVVSANSDTLTRYTRSNDLVTAETVFNTTSLANLTASTTLYTRSTTYDVVNAKITATDEFGGVTVYTLDPVWGRVKSVTLPDNTVVTDEYDADMCALMKRSFGTAAGRSNTLDYVGGNLSSLHSGSLSYTFGHTEGKLTAASKNNVSIEEHTHTTTQTDSYYPAKAGALHSTSAVFDKYGRLTSVDGVLTNVYDIQPRFHSTTGALIPSADNGSALLATSTDKVRSETARFTYTDKGLLKEKTVTDEANFANKRSVESFEYDAIDRLTKHTATYNVAGNKSVKAVIRYTTLATDPSPDNTVASYTYSVNGDTEAYTANRYDALHRLTSKSVLQGRDTVDKKFEYTATRVSKVTEKIRDQERTRHNYTYDVMGRIASDAYFVAGISAGCSTYEYDQYGQLKRENNQGLDKTYIYEYNGIGNLTAVKAYPFTLSTTPTGTPVTTSFGYTDDRLTSFGGTTISYNAMGCPTSYDGKTATWSKGKLSRLSRGTLTTGMDSYTYTYNGYGQRIARNYTHTQKSSGLESVQLGRLTACSRNYYYDHAGRLIAENCVKTLYGEGTATENIVFLYDESGIIGMELTTGGTTNLYYFQRNLQGDVVAIYDTNGTLKAKYLYDAWGNCTISGEATNYDVANANPIRYRGYYYDDDTGLYYCNARYYSPKWRRFISPDDTSYLDPENVNGLNLYCYCNNDPVNYADPSGSSAIVIGLIIGAILGFGAATYMDYRDDGQVFNGSIAWYDYLGATLLGSVAGAAIGYSLPAISSFAGTNFAMGGGLATLANGSLIVIPGITITGAKILITVGSAIALSGLVMFSKGSGPRMGHNQHEKQMWDEAMRRLGIRDKDLIRRLHNEIHKYYYQDTLKGLIAVLVEILKKWGLL